MDNPQTLQALLEGEAQRWENLAAVLETNHWLAEIVTVYRNHAARLRKLAKAMADRVVVRAEVRYSVSGNVYGALVRADAGHWCDEPKQAIAILQAHLTDDGRGWLEEG